MLFQLINDYFYSFPGYVHRYPSLTNSKDPREINDEFEEARRTWKECDACDMHIPQRTYHCSLCNACISIPDHHCYFLGNFILILLLKILQAQFLEVWNKTEPPYSQISKDI